jgi:hypothetical protein
MSASFSPQTHCPTYKRFYRRSASWVIILMLSLYSMIFSGIFLALALHSPRYGGVVSSHGPLSPNGAIVLTSVLAKSVELSFTTTFGVFVGQKLSRRAVFHKPGRGITLAEMTTRTWTSQPGTLVTRFTAARYAVFSFLGAFALVATVMGMLYTAAAQALGM